MIESLRRQSPSTQWRRCREDLRVDNRDDASREVTVEVWDGEERRHRATYELAPGQSGSALTVLTEGEYRVTATADGDRGDVAVVRVSDQPDETIVIAIDDGDVIIAGNDR